MAGNLICSVFRNGSGPGGLSDLVWPQRCPQNSAKRFWLGAASQAVRVVRVVLLVRVVRQDDARRVLRVATSVRVLHAAVFANRQTLAGSLEFLLADVLALAGFEALGGGLVGGGHGADEQHGGQGECGEELFHGRPFRLVGGRFLEDRTRWLHQGWLNRSATSVRYACMAGSSAASAATPAAISGTPASAGSQMR